MEIALNHAGNHDSVGSKTGVEGEYSNVLQSMAAFEAIREKMEQDLTNFFGCALKSFSDTVLK